MQRALRICGRFVWDSFFHKIRLGRGTNDNKIQFVGSVKQQDVLEFSDCYLYVVLDFFVLSTISFPAIVITYLFFPKIE